MRQGWPGNEAELAAVLFLLSACGEGQASSYYASHDPRKSLRFTEQFETDQ